MPGPRRPKCWSRAAIGPWCGRGWMMTRSLGTTEFRPGWADRVRRHVAIARAIVAFERIWPALWPATGIFGFGLTIALLDGFSPLSWPLHAFILACFVTAIGLALYLNLQ